MKPFCLMRILVVLALVCAPAVTWGQAIADRDLPPELERWKGWVLDQLGDQACPAIGGNAVCAWPGLLSLRVGARGADFRYEVLTDREHWVALPGSADHWPQDVQLGARPAVVTAEGDTPVARIPAGRHVLTGKLLWKQPPDSLTVPPKCARVELEANGKRIQFPRREKTTLWLQGVEIEAAADEDTAQDASEALAPDSLDLQVSRRLTDGLPLLIATHLELRVAGKPREVTVGKVLLGADELLGVESKDVPVRIDDGVLVAQVRPGTFTVRVLTALAKPPESLVAPKQTEPWPAQETWLWQPAEHYRQVEVSGGAAIDPNRTTLPPDFRRGSAYNLVAGGRLTLKTLRRGETEAPPNDIELERQMWLAQDGSSWKVQDHFSGTMRRTFRLDLTAGELGRFGAPGQDILLTHNPATHQPGIEVRQNWLNLVAESIHRDRTTLPAGGWSEDVQKLSFTVHTPPGWTLLDASGVDDFPGSPLRNLSLGRLLLIAIVAFGLGRLGRPWWGAVAAAGLLLGTQHWGSPLAPWLVAIAGLAAVRYAPWPILRGPLWVVSWIALLVLGARLADYATDLATGVLVPHGRIAAEWAQEWKETEQIAEANADNREGGTGTRAKGEEGSMGNARYAIKGPSSRKYGRVQIPGAPQPQDEMDEAPKAPPPPPKDVVMQMGPGMPLWRHNSWSLPIDGPVKKDHVIRLTLLSPGQNAALGLAEVGLLLFAFALVLRLAWQTRPPGRRTGSRAKAAAAAAGLLVLALPSVARAEIPSQDVLDELRTRLTRVADCDPCVSVSRVGLELSGPTIEVESEVHVVGTQGYQLPGPAESWLPSRVLVDGEPTQALLLHDDGSLYVRLTPGKHVVRATGGVARASLTFSLGTPPRRVEVRAKDWRVAGLSDEGVPTGALELTRSAGAAEETDEPRDVGQPETTEPTASGPDAPWLLITRSLSFGVIWTVTTKLERIGPSTAAVGLDYPLLAGEKINDPTVLIRAGKARLSLEKGQASREVKSTLPVSAQLTLVALSGVRASERWGLDPSEIWRCEHSGISPLGQSGTQSSGAAQPNVPTTTAAGFAPDFAPWPGEKLTLKLSRPEPAPGSSLTLDSVRMQLDPGPRALEAKLHVGARVSKAQPLRIALPADASVLKVVVNGEPRAIDRDDVKLNLEPGGYAITVEWKQPTGLGLLFRAPAVRLSHAAANVEIRMEVPKKRALLWLGGPSWGPRSIIWIPWLLLVALSLILGSLPRSPLPWWQWWVLGFGFIGGAGWVPLGLVVVWFFAVQVRGWSTALSWPWHNLRQVGLALLTLVALIALVVPFLERLTETPVLRWETGYQASGYYPGLAWYRDAIDGTLPQPFVLSVPDWLLHGLYVAWCAGVAWLGYRWAKWAWPQIGHEGLWLRRRAAAAAGGGPAVPIAGGPPAEAPRTDETATEASTESSNTGAPLATDTVGEDSAEEAKATPTDERDSKDADEDL